MKENSKSLQPQIDAGLADLISYEKKLTDQGMAMLQAGTGAFFAVDIFAVGVINRSLSLISGFGTLIKTSNYIGATHLVRPHLDNYLRFYAIWLVDNPHEFASKVMDGERIDKLKDAKGNLLRDSYLVSIAIKEYHWMEKVYKETSGFVHLSKKHILTSGKVKNAEKRVVEFRLSKEDKYVPDVVKIEAINCMMAITDCILNLLVGWTETKKLPQKELQSLKENETNTTNL